MVVTGCGVIDEAAGGFGDTGREALGRLVNYA